MQERRKKSASATSIKGATGDWEVVIGLEVHAQVASKAKLFSGASTEFGGRAQQPRLARRCGDARHAAGDQRGVRRAGGAHRPRAQGADQPRLACSTARTTSIPTCRRAIRSASTSSRSSARARSRSTSTARRMTVGIERLHLEQDAGKSIHDQHPDYSYVDLNRSGVALMEIVSQARHALGQAGAGLRVQAAHHPALSRHLRRRHGEGQPARRRQRLGAQARRQARHALRDQERQLDPLHRPGHRGRGAPPDRHPRGRRQDRPGDAAVRPRQGRDALDALQGRGARLPLLPRSRPAAAGADAGLRRRAEEGPAGAARRQEGALHAATTACPPTTPACWSPSARAPTTSRPSPRAATARWPPTG